MFQGLCLFSANVTCYTKSTVHVLWEWNRSLDTVPLLELNIQWFLWPFFWQSYLEKVAKLPAFFPHQEILHAFSANISPFTSKFGRYSQWTSDYDLNRFEDWFLMDFSKTDTRQMIYEPNYFCSFLGDWFVRTINYSNWVQDYCFDPQI